MVSKDDPGNDWYTMTGLQKPTAMTASTGQAASEHVH
jgi:hypothetical protein